MASAGISSRGGQLGGGGGGATTEVYYCFECDSTLTIVAASDSGLICPNCGGVVLEEFETPSSSPPPTPPPPPPPPPPRSTTLIDLQSFFPTSDTDSDIELYDLLPPPPPPFFITTATTSIGGATILPETNINSHPPPQPPPPLSRRNNRLWPLSPPPPPPPPSLSVIDRRRPCPQFPVPLAPTIDYHFLSPSDENDTTQYSHVDGGLDALRPTPSPPPPPPPPPEHLLRSLPLSPASSSDDGESFYIPPTVWEEDNPNQHMTSLIQSPQPLPPPPPQPLPPSSWDYFLQVPELNSPNHQRASQLQPPSPSPRLRPPPVEGLLDMKMTENMLSEWECIQCTICIDNFELNQMVKLMPCKHLYHSACILPWLDLHKSCPVCRYKLPS